MSDFSIQMSDITIQISNISIQIFNISIQMSNISIEISNISIQKSDISIEMLGFFIQKSDFFNGKLPFSNRMFGFDGWLRKLIRAKQNIGTVGYRLLKEKPSWILILARLFCLRTATGWAGCCYSSANRVFPIAASPLRWVGQEPQGQEPPPFSSASSAPLAG